MFVRLYTGEDGQSHFEDIEPPMGPVDQLAGAAAAIRRAEPGFHLDWHNAPRREYLVTLGGQVDIRTGDGTVMRFSTGDVMLSEDLTGCYSPRSRMAG